MKKLLLILAVMTTVVASVKSQKNTWCESLCWQIGSDCINDAQSGYAYCALGCSLDYLSDWINYGDWEAQLNYEYCINYCHFDQLWTEFYCQRDYDACIRDCND